MSKTCVSPPTSPEYLLMASTMFLPCDVSLGRQRTAAWWEPYTPLEEASVDVDSQLGSSRRSVRLSSVVGGMAVTRAYLPGGMLAA